MLKHFRYGTLKFLWVRWAHEQRRKAGVVYGVVNVFNLVEVILRLQQNSNISSEYRLLENKKTHNLAQQYQDTKTIWQPEECGAGVYIHRA